MRSDTAFFSAADISRRFLAGLASDLLSAAATAFVGGGEEERRDVERAVGGRGGRMDSDGGCIVDQLLTLVRRPPSASPLLVGQTGSTLSKKTPRQHGPGAAGAPRFSRRHRRCAR